MYPPQPYPPLSDASETLNGVSNGSNIYPETGINVLPAQDASSLLHSTRLPEEEFNDSEMMGPCFSSEARSSQIEVNDVRLSSPPSSQGSPGPLTPRSTPPLEYGSPRMSPERDGSETSNSNRPNDREEIERESIIPLIYNEQHKSPNSKQFIQPQILSTPIVMTVRSPPPYLNPSPSDETRKRSYDEAIGHSATPPTNASEPVLETDPIHKRPVSPSPSSPRRMRPESLIANNTSALPPSNVIELAQGENFTDERQDSLSPRSPKRMRAEPKPDTSQPQPDPKSSPSWSRDTTSSIPSTPVTKSSSFRPTHASIAASRKKFATPFRSPLISSASASPSSTAITKPATPLKGGSKVSQTSLLTTKNDPQHFESPTTARFSSPSSNVLIGASSSSSSSSPAITRINKNSGISLSKNVMKPFKSPVIKKSYAAGAISSVSGGKSTITILEKKLLTLKQARKIQIEGSIETLQALTAKWKTAARDVAEEVWSHLKDNEFSNLAPTDGPSSSAMAASASSGKNDDRNPFTAGWGYTNRSDDDEHKDGFDKNWGWGDDDRKGSGNGKGKGRALDSGDGDDDAESDHGEEGANLRPEEGNPAWTLGSMLNVLGIPKEVLGWNEEEGEFDA